MTESTGADAFISSLVAAGTRFVFGNPGTTEQAFLEALGRRDDIQLVVALHEGVAVGAAEGFARVSGDVGVVQLHTRCGLGNAMGMLANADFGGTPLVVFVGGPTQSGMHTEPALGGDIVAMASSVARWAWEIRSVDEIPTVVARAFKVAKSPPFGPVVIVVPNDLMDLPCQMPIVAPSWIPLKIQPSEELLDDVIDQIVKSDSPAIVIGDGITNEGGGAAIAVMAEIIGAPVFGAYLTQAVLPENFTLDAGELPLFDSRGASMRLRDHDLILAVGVDLLRSVFPRAGAPFGDQRVIHIGSDPWQLGKNQPCTAVFGNEEKTVGLISQGLVRRLGIELREKFTLRREVAARAVKDQRDAAMKAAQSVVREDPFSAEGVIAEIATMLPENTLLVDESVSVMPLVARWLPRRPARWFRSRGGGLGAGMSVPVGASLAQPGARIVSFVGDGASMYTITALWTAAHRRLPITWVILDNGGYRILEANTRAWRGGQGLDRPFVGTDLGDPALNIAGLGSAFGVSANRVESIEELRRVFPVALGQNPSIIHVVLNTPATEKVVTK